MAELVREGKTNYKKNSSKSFFHHPPVTNFSSKTYLINMTPKAQEAQATKENIGLHQKCKL